MNKVRNVGVRGGAPNTKIISPAAAANLGASKGNHVMGKGTVQRPTEPIVRGTASQVPLGNAVAGNVGKGGAGTGRIVHATGSQGQHGAAVQGSGPAPVDLLSQFGPEGRK